MLTTAAAYARYSTDNQKENSIAYQLDKIEDYCKENNIEIVAVYKDEGKTGTNTDRQGFSRLLSAARRKEFDSVVIYDTTRGSRDVGDWFAFRKEMFSLNIKVLSATQQLGDITNPSDFITELISVGLGQHAVLDTRQKSIAGVAAKAKQGKFLGGVAPLGYDIIDGSYIVNKQEAKIVKKIFALYASGKSYDYIINNLNGAKGKHGRPLGKTSLYNILKNDRYIGRYTWNRRKIKLFRKWAGGAPNPDCISIEGAIPSIIEISVWERVQERMKSNKQATNKAKREYLLSGLITCEKCGGNYVGHTSTNKKGYQTSYYVCGTKYRTKQCNAPNINANEIETFVVAHLKEHLKDQNCDNIVSFIMDKYNTGKSDITPYKRELVEIEKKIKNGVDAILEGIEIPELQSRIDELRGRKVELMEIIKAAENSSHTVTAADIMDHLNKNLWSEEKKGEIIKEMVKIYAHTDGTFHVNMGVHMDSSGGKQYVVCATHIFIKKAA